MARWPWWLVVVALGAGCAEETGFGVDDPEICRTRRDGARYCIEVYEASREDATVDTEGIDEASPARSRPDRLPWTEITWAAARAACEAKGKRLCDFDEWIDACDGTTGDGGLVYTYGDTRDESNMTCNTGSGAPEPTGRRMACESPDGALDLSGNVWEWTGNTRNAAAARGGGFRSTQTHMCSSSLMNVSPSDENPEVGFRCCRDV